MAGRPPPPPPPAASTTANATPTARTPTPNAPPPASTAASSATPMTRTSTPSAPPPPSSAGPPRSQPPGSRPSPATPPPPPPPPAVPPIYGLCVSYGAARHLIHLDFSAQSVAPCATLEQLKTHVAVAVGIPSSFFALVAVVPPSNGARAGAVQRYGLNDDADVQRFVIQSPIEAASTSYVAAPSASSFQFDDDAENPDDDYDDRGCRKRRDDDDDDTATMASRVRILVHQVEVTLVGTTAAAAASARSGESPLVALRRATDVYLQSELPARREQLRKLISAIESGGSMMAVAASGGGGGGPLVSPVPDSSTPGYMDAASQQALQRRRQQADLFRQVTLSRSQRLRQMSLGEAETRAKEALEISEQISKRVVTTTTYRR
jgi:hypothetical protein